MLGSAFIYAPDPSRLALIAEDSDALDDFDHVNLDALLSLDFTLICSSSGVEWCAKEPEVFDEASGIAIVRVNPEALHHVIANKHGLSEEQASDVELLEAFAAKHGFDHLTTLDNWFDEITNYFLDRQTGGFQEGGRGVSQLEIASPHL